MNNEVKVISNRTYHFRKTDHSITAI